MKIHHTTFAFVLICCFIGSSILIAQETIENSGTILVNGCPVGMKKIGEITIDGRKEAICECPSGTVKMDGECVVIIPDNFYPGDWWCKLMPEFCTGGNPFPNPPPLPGTDACDWDGDGITCDEEENLCRQQVAKDLKRCRDQFNNQAKENCIAGVLPPNITGYTIDKEWDNCIRKYTRDHLDSPEGLGWNPFEYRECIDLFVKCCDGYTSVRNAFEVKIGIGGEIPLGNGKIKVGMEEVEKLSESTGIFNFSCYNDLLTKANKCNEEANHCPEACASITAETGWKKIITEKFNRDIHHTPDKITEIIYFKNVYLKNIIKQLSIKLWEKKDYSNAIHFYKLSTELYPNDSSTWIDLSNAYKKTGYDGLSKKIIFQSIKYNPNDIKLLNSIE